MPGQVTMSSYNGYLSGEKFALPVMLTGQVRIYEPDC